MRPTGGRAWLTTLTACMRALDFTPEATRTALHRMAAEGWVAPTKIGRFAAYQLTDPGIDRLEEAAERIYRLRAAEWDGQWHVLVCPAAARNPDLAKELRWTGHGRLAADVWVSPHPQGARLERLLAIHGARDQAVRLCDANVAGADHDRIVGAAWDLTELRNAHAAFIAQWQGTPAPATPEDAFTTRIRLVHHWRSFLFLDPGLPAQLLPGDWLGDAAAAVFRDLYDAVDAQAWRYYDALTAQAPPLPSAGHAAAGPTPGAALSALQTSR